MAERVGKASEVATPGSIQVYQVEGRPVAVTNIDGKLFGFSDICTHMGCTLSDGPASGNVIICACHGSQFDMTTGDVVRGPAWMPLETYTVAVEGDELLLAKVVIEEEPVPEPAAAAATSPAAAPAPQPASEARHEEDITALSQVPLFAGLSPETLESLEAFTFRKSFKAGDLIVEEGRTGNGLYVVLSGYVEVLKGQGERGQAVAQLGPGEPFGEMALLGEWPRTASVKAVGETTCLGMDRWVFMAHIRREPELALRMLQLLAERLMKTDQKFLE